MRHSSADTNFDDQEFPLNCEKCKRPGFIFIKDSEKPYFAVCRKCGGETSNVWCPTCGMGGSFVRNIKKHPSTWSCPGCQTRYSLPTGFYENPVSLYGLEELPKEIRERIRRSLEAARQKLTGLRLLGLILIIVMVLVIAVWPLAISYALSLMLHDDLWLMLGVAVMLFWVFLGLPKALKSLNPLIMRFVEAVNKREAQREDSPISMKRP